MNLILIGAPGSGKGTQGKIIARQFGYTIISIGEILRKEIDSNSEIGLSVKSYMAKGELVPDDIIVKIVENCIAQKDCQNGFILDGFPRNLNQAIIFDRMIAASGKKIDLVLNFKISEEFLIKRILGRFTCRECGAIYNRFFKTLKKDGICDSCGSESFENRSDDTEQVIKKRIKIYNNTASDLINHYRKNNLLVSLDASLNSTILFETIRKSLKEI